MPNSDIEEYIKALESEVKSIKDELFRISWYMRGGVSSHDLFHNYSYEDRTILNIIIKDNIDVTKSTRMPLL